MPGQTGVAFQPGAYSPVTVYDAPGVFLTQFFEGEANFRNFANTFFADDAALTASERDSYIDYFKKTLGGNPFVDAVLDVAMNPWVWMAFLTTPVGISAVGAGTKSLWEVGGGYMSYVGKNLPLLHHFATASQITDGTPISFISRAVSGLLKDHKLEFEKGTRAAKAAFLQKNGLQNLDPNDAFNTGKVELVKKIQYAMRGALEGWDRPLVKEVSKARPVFFDNVTRMKVTDPKVIEELTAQWKAQSGKGLLEFEGTTAHAATPHRPGTEYIKGSFGHPSHMAPKPRELDPTKFHWEVSKEIVETPAIVAKGSMEGFINSLPGGPEYLKATRDALDLRLLRMYGTEDAIAEFKRTGIFNEAWRTNPRTILDRNKMFRIFRTMNNEEFHRYLTPEDWDVVGALFNKETIERLHRTPHDAGNMEQLMNILPKTEEEFFNLASEGFSNQMKSSRHYAPKGMPTLRYKADPAAPLVPGRVKDYELLDPYKVYDPDRSKNVLEAAQAAHPTTLHPLYEDPVHLQEIDDLFGLTGDGKVLQGNGVKLLEEQIKKNGTYVKFRSLDTLDQSIEHYMDATGRTLAWGGTDVLDHRGPLGAKMKEILRISKGMLGATDPKTGEKLFPETGQHWKYPLRKPGGVESPLHVPMDEVRDAQRPLGGFSLQDALEQSLRMSPNADARNYVREIMIPAVNGKLIPNANISQVLAYPVHVAAKALSKMSFIKDLSEVNTFGERLAARLKNIADMDLVDFARNTGQEITGWTYSTHLGLNPASVILNLLQPWLHASAIYGTNNVAKGYMDAFRELGHYANLRLKMGKLRISDIEKRKAMENSFEFLDEVGITGHQLEDLDPLLYGGKEADAVGNFRYWTQQFPLKAFEKAEWLNRLVTGHAAKHMHIDNFEVPLALLENPNTVERARMLYDIRRGVEETQFGSGPLNTPKIFMTGALSDPMLRQFRSFALRSASMFPIMSGRLAKGTRYFGAALGGQGINFKGSAASFDILRMIGHSAVTYELGKNLIGADMSRAGATQALTDVFGSRFLESDSPIADFVGTTPSVTIPTNLIRGIIGGDMDLIADAFMRSMPGGVGLRRVSQVVDPTGLVNKALIGLPEAVQRRYVRWDQKTPEGMVPVYKTDGGLIDYQSPSAIIMRGLGMDLGKHKKGQEFDHWLATQRPQILDARRKVIQAALANDQTKVARLQADFMKRFQFPLTVSKAQLRSFVRNRTTPRSERMIDRLPRESRRIFLESLAQTKAPQMAMSQAALRGAPTALQRTQQFGRHNPISLQPGETDALRQLIQAKKQEEEAGTKFTGFKSYLAKPPR